MPNTNPQAVRSIAMKNLKKQGMETGIEKTREGYQVFFSIKNQRFYLEEQVENTDEESLEVARFFEEMLKTAFEKLQYKSQKKL